MKPTGKCPYCDRVFELRKDGKLRAHTRADGFVPNCRHPCEGSGLQFEQVKRRKRRTRTEVVADMMKGVVMHPTAGKP